MDDVKLPRKRRTSARPTIQRPQEWGSIVRAVQGNFEHIMNVIRAYGKAHNSLVDDVRAVKDVIEGTIDTVGTVEASVAQLAITGGADHDVLEHDDANTSPTPSNGDVLTWDSTPGEWVAAAPAAGSWPGDIRARVYMSGNQAITTATVTALTWDSETYDTNTFHSTSSNTNRLTIPADGTYILVLQVLWESNATGYRACYIRDDATVYAASDVRNAVSGTNTISHAITSPMVCTAGDWFEAAVLHNKGSNADVQASEQYCWFAIYRIA